MAVVLDLTNTAHCRSATGVQRVARELYAALQEIGAEPVALIYDKYGKRWRLPDAQEKVLLTPNAADTPAQNRREAWTLGQKITGYLRRGAEPDWGKLRGAPMLAPEIFSAKNFAAHADLRRKLAGPAGAIFYDAVALKLPHLTPTGNVARVENYLRELASFDGVAAISAASREDLGEQWKRLGVREPPPVTAIPLGVNPPRLRAAPLSPEQARVGTLVLCVGSIEGRKNHRALLEAADRLWREGRQFHLTLAGLLRPETAAEALALAEKLQSAGRPLQLTGATPEPRLEELYAKCRFTVYPSLYEGFGLPVAESLLRQRPCICGTGGALAEVAAGGGCLTVDVANVAQLAATMRHLLDDNALHARLSAEAARRTFATWQNYAQSLKNWMDALPVRAPA